MRSCEVVPLIAFVLSMYHFRARTGHQSLSEEEAECDRIDGTKMSGGRKEGVWFLVRNLTPGMRRTPRGSHLI